jgi:hypothetical protein
MYCAATLSVTSNRHILKRMLSAMCSPLCKANMRRTNLKEVKNTLRLSIEGVNSIDQAVLFLNEIVGMVGVD